MLVWKKGNIEKKLSLCYSSVYYYNDAQRYKQFLQGNIEKKLSLCYSSVYYYNDAQRYKQFLQVGRLYRALILFGLALCLPSASVSSVFMMLY